MEIQFECVDNRVASESDGRALIFRDPQTGEIPACILRFRPSEEFHQSVTGDILIAMPSDEAAKFVTKVEAQVAVALHEGDKLVVKQAVQEIAGTLITLTL